MSDSALPHACPQCGAALPAEATEGLCPRCLLSQAIQTPSDAQASSPHPFTQVPAPEDLAPHFPHYEILRMLGRGGMGAVYLARQSSLDRLVAIKILPAVLDDGENNFAERFKNEARAMARLSHPGIVAVHDFGVTSDGLLYIVMEYIDGTDVAQMVAGQGRLHSAHAMAITAHVCDALSYAHAAGIIHRDIKPSNIMIRSDGVVKVADFGLAKMSQAAQSTGLTQSGLVMGTVHFMAPEALTLGNAVDERADIYALGVMLYQMLTGKLPQGMFEMPSLQVPGLDPRYDGIVAKALREDRERRYQNAGELRHDLDAILTQPVAQMGSELQKAVVIPSQEKKSRRTPGPSPQPALPVPLGWRSRLGLIAAGSLALLALAAGGYFFRLSSADRQAATPLLAARDQPFMNSLGMKFVPVPLVGSAAEGRRVLFSIWEVRVQDYQVFVRETGTPWQEAVLPQEADHPAVYVSWNDAAAFSAWLTGREVKAGIFSPHHRYRLPTDHEWSCAVGIGDRENETDSPDNKKRMLANVFPWGGTWPPPTGAGNYWGEEMRPLISAGLARQNWNTKGELTGYRDDHGLTAPVGSYTANAYGIHDLSGNVWEWCGDWYDSARKGRVMRGASWRNSDAPAMALSNRVGETPDSKGSNTGFRIVLDISEPAASADPATTAPAP